jgi:hypothetical protein
MSNNEIFRVQLPEQVRTCLATSEKTLQYYIPEGIPDLRRGAKFKNESAVEDEERKVFLEENTIASRFGGENEQVIDQMFEPNGKVASVDGSILLSSKYFSPLFRLQGQNLKDRQFVSNLDVMLFDMVASSTLQTLQKEVKMSDKSALVTGYLKDFGEFVDLMASENRENKDLADFKTDFEDFVANADFASYALKVKGLCISLCYEDRQLFTEGYDVDQAMRFLFVNKMRNKFIPLMEKKSTWFSPSEIVRKDINIDAASDNLAVILERFANIDDSNALLSLYLNGQIGVARAEILDASSSKDLAALIKRSMLSGDEDKNSYDEYEFEEAADISEQVEVEDEEEIYELKPFKARRIVQKPGREI